jgi:hypothetical protein
MPMLQASGRSRISLLLGWVITGLGLLLLLKPSQPLERGYARQVLIPLTTLWLRVVEVVVLRLLAVAAQEVLGREPDSQ